MQQAERCAGLVSWVRIDDRLPDHPKVAPLSDAAFRAMIRALCYANSYLTDGVLPSAFLNTVKPSVRRTLLEARVWEQSDQDVIRIHDYHDFQEDRDTVETRRQETRDRVRKWRERQREKRDGNSVTGNTVTGDVTRLANAGVTAPPSHPDPIPAHSQPEDVPEPKPSEVVASATWELAKAKIQADLNPEYFERWMGRLEVWRETERELELRAPSVTIASWVKQHHQKLITDALGGKRWSVVVKPLATRSA